MDDMDKRYKVVISHQEAQISALKAELDLKNLLIIRKQPSESSTEIPPHMMEHMIKRLFDPISLEDRARLLAADTYYECLKTLLEYAMHGEVEV